MRVSLPGMQLLKNKIAPRLRVWRIAGPPAVRRGVRKTWFSGRWVISKLLPVALFAIAGYMLASSILTSQPNSVIGLVIGIAGLGLIVWRIEIGIIALVAIMASVIYPAAIPKPFTIAGEGFSMTEILLLAMTVLVFFRHLGQKRGDMVKSPFVWPLLLFFLAVAIKTVMSYVDQSPLFAFYLTFPKIYNQGPRDMVGYLLFFIVAFGIEDKKQLNRFWRVLIWMTCIGAFLMVVQAIVGQNHSVFIGAGATESYTRNGIEQGDVVRSLVPALSPMLWLFLSSLMMVSVLGIRRGQAAAVAAAMMGVGILFSFTRHYWLAIIVATLVLAGLSDWAARRRMAIFGLVLIISVLQVSLVIGQVAKGGAGGKFSKAVTERFMSTFEDKTYKSDSLKNRYVENRNAVQLIKKYPIWGPPLTQPFEYREQSRRFQTYFVPYTYIHNSYFYIYLRYGLLGVISLLWLWTSFMVCCFRLFRRLKTPRLRAMALGMFGGGIVMLVKASTGNVFDQSGDICTMSVMWATSELMWRFYVETDITPLGVASDEH